MRFKTDRPWYSLSLFKATVGLVTLASPVAILAADPPKPTPKDAAASAAKVSYYKQIKPIFQTSCQGCHQPAKPQGGYVMTDFARLLKAGDSKEAPIVAGKPDESYLFDQIVTQNGKAEMPKDKPPLAASDIDLVRQWISQGAVDDTPASALARFDSKNLPVYPRPVTVTSLDFAPTGNQLAVAGFHEVLLIDPSSGKIQNRLIGLSERIETVRYSPDGKLIAVAGGTPAQSGELQIWNVESAKLVLSVPVGFDTIYGASWSPDGTKIAVGCGDNSVRAFDTKTGAQVLFQGAHNDWVRDTIFTKDGSHLISVGRDMTTKLTEVATQRFVDNLTSITPGALKGGILALARHPQRDEIVLAGSDSVVKVYRTTRLTARVIGDDANLIRKMPAMKGRVWSVDVSPNGKRIVAGSSLDGKGQIHVYSYEFDTGLPDGIKAIVAKTGHSPDEAKKLEAYLTKDVKLIASIDVPATGIYSVSFSADSKTVAAAGSDGLIRMIETETGKVLRNIPAMPTVVKTIAAKADGSVPKRLTQTLSAEALPKGSKIVSLDVEPKSLVLDGRYDYAQVVVIGRLDSGDTVDATRLAKISQNKDLLLIAPTGIVQPKSDGTGELTFVLGSAQVKVPVQVTNFSNTKAVDYLHDVTPILSRLGCNQGTCHGSAQGKNGFKLSLRGYDAIFDTRALTDDLAARRTNPVAPDNSLMLQKASGRVPHAGGSLTLPGEAHYEILKDWIAAGAALNLNTPRVTKLDIFPKNPIIQSEGDLQQFRIQATYADGKTRDVTQEVYLESANNEVATASPRGGLLTAQRRGEAPVLARYEGSYIATTLTVMGDRTGFAWKEPESWSEIDRLAASKWKRMKIEPSGLADDATFLRRMYLDLTGLPPTSDEVKAFLADTKPTREKRSAAIDKLIGSKPFVDHWTNKWADLLQVNRKFLAPEGAVAFRAWIRDQVQKNVPYDQFVKSILVATGSTKENPAANYYKILRDPAPMMENTTHLFLSVRFNCNKCHDHPFERWTQDQYYQTAAYFARLGLENDPASQGRTIGGSAVEGATPLYEVIKDRPAGEVTHERTGQVAPPKFPYEIRKVSVSKNVPTPKPVAVTKEVKPVAESASSATLTRRQELAEWITSPSNEYFARSYVNRLWGYMFGIGLMEPIDDLRAGNPPSNPELLDHLTQEFIRSNFNVQQMIRMITKSRTYQLSYESNKWNEDDKINYSHALPRRLPAEVLYDAIIAVTGTSSKFPGVAAGTRAAELPDNGVELPSGFLNTFGRPVRESACECERTSGMQLGPIMALVSGPTVADAISDPTNALVKLVAENKDDRQLVDALVTRILNRPAKPSEINSVLKLLAEIDTDNTNLEAILAKAEAAWKPVRAKLDTDRTSAVLAAENAVKSRQAIVLPIRQKAEADQVKKVADAQAALKLYDQNLPQKLAQWQTQNQQSQVEWIPLRINEFEKTPGAQFLPQEDRSIFVQGKPDSGDYKFKVRSNLQNITAIRLEALSDPRLPSKGPGLSDNGNFVVNEFQVTATSQADAKIKKDLAFAKPLQDFAQQSFSVAALFDKNLDRGNGWAIIPAVGVTHWGTFETSEPVGFVGGTELNFTIVQRFGQRHNLGRFRISVAVSKKDVGLSLPEEFQAILGTPPRLRSKPQQDAIASYFRTIDPEGQKLQVALAEAQKPIPPDAELESLKAKLELAKRPVMDDSKLVQLRDDMKQSISQRTNKRLTVAQDLAWALINSPAFLFNH